MGKSRTFFTSDWHLDHRRILTYCRRLQFMNDGERQNYLDAEKRGASKEEMRQLQYSRESVERMNSAIIDHANEVAGPDDRIIICGDVIFGDLEKLRRLRQRIICRNIHLIFGNHDKDIRYAWYSGDLRDVFASAQDVGKFDVDGQSIWCSHYAHVVWNKSHWGVWHCYGHSHASLEPWREEHMPKARMVDVGIDYRAKLGKGYTFWSFEELRKYMNAKQGDNVDHHGED